MVDWTKSMQQTFEYYIVDPATWKDVRKLTNVKSCIIERDSEANTLGSATIDIAETLGECYVRVYLITIQNGVRERHPLGTFLAQTPSTAYDGKTTAISIDMYTPLLELKEGLPPIGYSILEETNIMDIAYRLVRENARAPVVEASCDETLYCDFVSNVDDTWMTFLMDLIANAKYEFGLDELGRILFLPKQDTASLQPIWTFDDSNSSILYPEFTMSHDLYGIPNAVEVIWSGDDGHYYSKAVNNDPNSLISTVNRGREIIHRVSNPDLNGNPAQGQIDEYAKQLLRDMSTIEYTISYTHGYVPVRLGDCVRLNYGRANVSDVKAKVVSQTIKCVPGCPVTEKAMFTKRLWG